MINIKYERLKGKCFYLSEWLIKVNRARVYRQMQTFAQCKVLDLPAKKQDIHWYSNKHDTIHKSSVCRGNLLLCSFPGGSFYHSSVGEVWWFYAGERFRDTQSLSKSLNLLNNLDWCLGALMFVLLIVGLNIKKNMKCSIFFLVHFSYDFYVVNFFNIWLIFTKRNDFYEESILF